MAKKKGFPTKKISGGGKGKNVSNPKTFARSAGQALDVKHAFRGANKQIAGYAGLNTHDPYQ